MNLFNFFRLRINLYFPFDLGIKKIGDVNCPSQYEHSEIAPKFVSLSISI